MNNESKYLGWTMNSAGKSLKGLKIRIAVTHIALNKIDVTIRTNKISFPTKFHLIGTNICPLRSARMGSMSPRLNHWNSNVTEDFWEPLITTGCKLWHDNNHNNNDDDDERKCEKHHRWTAWIFHYYGEVQIKMERKDLHRRPRVGVLLERVRNRAVCKTLCCYVNNRIVFLLVTSVVAGVPWLLHRWMAVSI